MKTSDWHPPGKYMKNIVKRPLPKHCEFMFSDREHMGNSKKLVPCKKAIKYQCEQNALYFCNECAHTMAKRNRDLTFIKVVKK